MTEDGGGIRGFLQRKLSRAPEKPPAVLREFAFEGNAGKAFNRAIGYVEKLRVDHSLEEYRDYPPSIEEIIKRLKSEGIQDARLAILAKHDSPVKGAAAFYELYKGRDSDKTHEALWERVDAPVATEKGSKIPAIDGFYVQMNDRNYFVVTKELNPSVFSSGFLSYLQNVKHHTVLMRSPESTLEEAKYYEVIQPIGMNVSG